MFFGLFSLTKNKPTTPLKGFTMRVLSAVIARLEETAAAPEWFTKMSKEKQKKYAQLHPGSKVAKTGARPSLYPASGGSFDNLVSRVWGGDKTVLNHPDIAKVKNNEGNTPLHYAARHFKEALNHPDVAKVKNDRGSTPLHHAAYYFKDALKHPDVSKVKNDVGDTPLHHAAHAFKEAIKHPDVSKVKNTWGNTPLHEAAGEFKEALNHPDADKVKNKRGMTPSRLAARSLK